jgi:hypothetical protein
MDDLTGLSWSSQPERDDGTQPYQALSPPSIATLRPTPTPSGRSTPLSSTTLDLSSTRQTSKPDSFSSLVSFGSASSAKGLSLQEQQKRLLQEKAQQQKAKQKELDSHYGVKDERFWNDLGSGRSAPAPVSGSPGATTLKPPHTSGSSHRSLEVNGSSLQSTARIEDDEDLLAAFSAGADVDSSSHFPKPSGQPSSQSHSRDEAAANASLPSDIGMGSVARDANVFGDDDDPFGLADLPTKQSRSFSQTTMQDCEDDVLGLLGKPISELPQPKPVATLATRLTKDHPVHPQDQALSELTEMGFPPELARSALESTESGTDVQKAVGWLLNRAHSETKDQLRSRRGGRRDTRRDGDPRIDSGTIKQQINSRSDCRPVGRPQRSPSDTSSNIVEKDPAQVASELSANFLKTAGSIWKTSTKKVQQAVQDFNSDSDSSVPRWMRESRLSESDHKSDQDKEEQASLPSRRRASMEKESANATNEAKMLDTARARPSFRRPPKRQNQPLDSSADNSGDNSPAMPPRRRQEFSEGPDRFREQHTKWQPRVDLKAGVNRQAIDDQASKAYVSSARRRKPASTSPLFDREPDLLQISSRSKAKNSFPEAATRKTFPRDRPSISPIPASHRPSPIIRNIPSVSSVSLNASHKERSTGNEQFKRGDYAAAHTSYTSSLKHLPSSHPITIVLLTNRALTSLKIGEPKMAITDSETVINVVGASRGESEVVDLTNGDVPKPMRDYLGKALMRKAEALEQMEKWKEAAVVWKEAIEGGHGGVISMQGRARCEKAAAPGRTDRTKSSRIQKTVKQGPVRSVRPVQNGPATSVSSTAAVSRLRAANVVADKVDDEKFALTDSVDAQLVAWKGSKSDNLRALLGSLDTVLWPEAGWKKIGMAELVLPAKVKVQYMKGIAKVHPDKVRESIWSAETCCGLHTCCHCDGSRLIGFIASNHRHDGAAHDCSSSFQHSERGLGQIQDRQWAVIVPVESIKFYLAWLIHHICQIDQTSELKFCPHLPWTRSLPHQIISAAALKLSFSTYQDNPRPG